MNIRIHHFFDIIRDFGSEKKFDPHPYLHSYHNIAREIWENSDLEFEIVIKSDAVCTGCTQLRNTFCVDSISHRKDFTQKETFNNYLDNRIIAICQIHTSRKYSPKTLCEIAAKYIENIEFIYHGNDKEHTQLRKKNVILGLKYYSEKHGIKISLDH